MMDAALYQEVLRDHLVPFMERHGTTMFLQDGAPPHRAKTMKAYLAMLPYEIIKWPGNSPDLNPIENCWNWMKDQLKETNHRNLKELEEDVKKLWCTVTPTEYLRELIRSMPRRMAKVIDRGGALTKY